jgi:hypothetical protein
LDALISILVGLAIVVLILILVATWGLRGPEIIAAGFLAYRPEGWPRGVQETDEPWGWRDPEIGDPDATRAIAVAPIGTATVRRGRSLQPGQRDRS